MKKCPFCGADIEDSARFCLYCMQPLTEKEQILLRKQKKPQWLPVIAAIVAILLIFATIYFYQQTEQEADRPSEDPQLHIQTELSDTPPTTETSHIHSYSVENTAVKYRKQAATCTTPAVYYYACRCGEKSSETFSHGALAEHTVVTDPGYCATCVKTGLTDGSHCSVCKLVFSAQTPIPVIGHTFDDDRDDCCNVCHYIRVLNCKHETTVQLPAIAPTCTANGLTEGKTCALCDEILVAQTTLAPLGHREVIDQAVAPTCTAEGKTEGKHCLTCNAVLVPQLVRSATGHREVIDQAVAPTCTADGKTEGKHCLTCNAVLVPQLVRSAIDHTEVIDQAVAATCTAPGKTEGKHCSVCKTVIQAQTALPPLGHNIVVWEEGFPATCTTPGKTNGTRCSICHEDFEYSYTIPATYHCFSVEDSPSSCLKCGASETLTIVAPQLPLVANSFGSKKPFRIDRITYSLKPIAGGKFQIEFTFYGTNISSERALFEVSANLYGPNNVSLSCSISQYLAPDQSDIYKASAQISDSNGTYTLVFD